MSELTEAKYKTTRGTLGAKRRTPKTGRWFGLDAVEDVEEGVSGQQEIDRSITQGNRDVAMQINLHDGINSNNAMRDYK